MLHNLELTVEEVIFIMDMLYIKERDLHMAIAATRNKMELDELELQIKHVDGIVKSVYNLGLSLDPNIFDEIIIFNKG